MALFTPTNQKRLTNVSVIRLRKGGNRYELACYPNKVRAWRDRLETNLDEVLQIQNVFTNVSKGQLANKKEMLAAFRTEDETQIIKTILEQGELHLTEKERAMEQKNTFRDVAKIISERCVNPETNRAYTVTMIEKMMKDCHISLKTNKTVKQHALEVIKQLRTTEGFKIAPAMMEVVLSIDASVVDSVKDRVLELSASCLREGLAESGNYDLALVIEPEKYGHIDMLLRREIKGKYCFEIMGNTKHAHCLSTSQPSTSQSSTTPSESHPTPSHPDKADVQPPQSGAPAENPQESEPSKPTTSTGRSGDAPKRSNKRRNRKNRKGRNDDWPDDD